MVHFMIQAQKSVYTTVLHEVQRHSCISAFLIFLEANTHHWGLHPKAFPGSKSSSKSCTGGILLLPELGAATATSLALRSQASTQECCPLTLMLWPLPLLQHSSVGGVRPLDWIWPPEALYLTLVIIGLSQHHHQRL